jgi:RNA polymerase sigma-70 factor (ECF subfamily)
LIGDDAWFKTRASLLIRLRQEPTDQRDWDEFAQQYGRLIRTWCQRWALQVADAGDVSQNRQREGLEWINAQAVPNSKPS